LFEVRFSHKAAKFVGKCDKKVQKRLKLLFEVLQHNPLPARFFDLRKIAGERNMYRIRIASYRIVYAVYWEPRLIRVIKIERRKERTYKL
jgi:mRNA interferase RelE/StbE